MADYICVAPETIMYSGRLVSRGVLRVSDASCDYVLMTATTFESMHSTTQGFMDWFIFNPGVATVAFGGAFALWALGIKLGALIRTLFSARR